MAWRVETKKELKMVVGWLTMLAIVLSIFPSSSIGSVIPIAVEEEVIISSGWGDSFLEAVEEILSERDSERNQSRVLLNVRHQHPNKINKNNAQSQSRPLKSISSSLSPPSSLRTQAAALATTHFSAAAASESQGEGEAHRQTLTRPQPGAPRVSHHSRPVMQHSSFPKFGKAGPQLRCEKPSAQGEGEGARHYSISGSVNATVGDVRAYGITPQQCPCAFDRFEKCHQAPHMCVATNPDFFCSFRMSRIIVSDWGALIDTATHQVVRFDHASIAGGADPQYFPMINSIFLKGFEIALQKHNPHAARPEADLVVPTRTRWDDCFNHLSFQSMPILALTYTFHQDLWREGAITWQASRYTAAMLLLLGVKKDRIVIEKQVLAKQLLLPWLPSWNPLQVSAHKGIAAKMAWEMTQSLLTMKIPQEQEESVKHFFIGQGVDRESQELIPLKEEVDKFLQSVDQKKQRLIVFLARLSDATRSVVNERELFSWIERGINTEQYRFVFLGATDPYRTIETLHVLWRRYAKFLSRAKLVIGPHGKCLAFACLIVNCFNTHLSLSLSLSISVSVSLSLSLCLSLSLFLSLSVRNRWWHEQHHVDSS
jgi:hypothetical protein